MDFRRLFVAVELPKEVKEELAFACKHFIDLGLFEGKCISFENTHVTLKFIGPVCVDDIAKIDHALRNVSASSCSATLGQLGVLPTLRIVRILFANLDCYCLPIIAKQIETALEQYLPNLQDQESGQEFGISQMGLDSSIGSGENLSRNRRRKEREFKNHITIARIKNIKNKEDFLYAVENFNLQEIKFDIKEFVLKESELTVNGPIYTTIGKYNLF